ncbi:MAG TPA: hypothetical protein VM325_01000 [Alphaproteobacteria bacterium]|nr:hypothetical protein [Alphaproteobacteria bacterium]
MFAALHPFGFKDWLRRLAGAALIAVGVGLFVTVFGHRGYIDILQMRMVVAEAGGSSVGLSRAVWLEMLDGALFPSIWLFAAAGPGILLLARAGRHWVRRVGAALIVWSASVAMLAFPPFLTRPDFDPAPWSPFLIAVAVGAVPGALLIAGASQRRKLRVASEIGTG